MSVLTLQETLFRDLYHRYLIDHLRAKSLDEYTGDKHFSNLKEVDAYCRNLTEDGMVILFSDCFFKSGYACLLYKHLLHYLTYREGIIRCRELPRCLLEMSREYMTSYMAIYEETGKDCPADGVVSCTRVYGPEQLYPLVNADQFRAVGDLSDEIIPRLLEQMNIRPLIQNRWNDPVKILRDVLDTTMMLIRNTPTGQAVRSYLEYTIRQHREGIIKRFNIQEPQAPEQEQH